MRFIIVTLFLMLSLKAFSSPLTISIYETNSHILWSTGGRGYFIEPDGVRPGRPKTIPIPYDKNLITDFNLVLSIHGDYQKGQFTPLDVRVDWQEEWWVESAKGVWFEQSPPKLELSPQARADLLIFFRTLFKKIDSLTGGKYNKPAFEISGKELSEFRFKIVSDKNAKLSSFSVQVDKKSDNSFYVTNVNGQFVYRGIGASIPLKEAFSILQYYSCPINLIMSVLYPSARF